MLRIYIAALVLFVGLTVLPALVSAATLPYWGPILSCTADFSNIQDPTVPKAPTEKCTSLCDALKTGQNIINLLLTLILFIGVPVGVLLGGGALLMSGGLPKMISLGKQILTGAVVGAVLALGAYVIVNTVLRVVGNRGAGADTRVAWPDFVCNPKDLPGGIIQLEPPIPWVAAPTSTAPGKTMTSSGCRIKQTAKVYTYICYNDADCGGVCNGKDRICVQFYSPKQCVPGPTTTP